MKKSLSLLLVGLLIGSFILTAYVSADLFDVFGDSGKLGENISAVKFLYLVLVFLLVLSVFQIMKFPESAALRFLLSVVVSFLVTLLIKAEDVYGLITTYTGLGFAIITFLPIMVLVVFSLALGKRGDVFGFASTMVMWLVYSVFLIYNGVLVLLLKMSLKTPILNVDQVKEILNVLNNTPVVLDYTISSFDPKWAAIPFKYMMTWTSDGMIEFAIKTNILMGILMLVIGGFAFYFGVINQSIWRHWIAEKLREEKINLFTDELEASSAYRKGTAEQVKKAGQ